MRRGTSRCAHQDPIEKKVNLIDWHCMRERPQCAPVCLKISRCGHCAVPIDVISQVPQAIPFYRRPWHRCGPVMSPKWVLVTIAAASNVNWSMTEGLFHSMDESRDVLVQDMRVFVLDIEAV